MAGFTSLAEQLQLEQVSQVLNEHFSAMAAIVMAHGGTIDKLIGDAVMAFWRAPLEDEIQALHAWQPSLQRWRELAPEPACEKIAALYIKRIEQFLQEPPVVDWDGAFALEKM